jgi:elongation factor P
MLKVSTNDLKQGMRVDIDNQPYTIVGLEFVKPGKGQAFTRVKIKSIFTGRVIEKTYRSNEKLDIADVEDTSMRLLYKDGENAVFMDDASFEQVSIPLAQIGETSQWLMDDQLYLIIFYNKSPVNIDPPTFMEMVITETDPGVRGDTASGRVMKSAITESGAKVQVPIFIEQGEKIKIDTRTGEYVSRSNA